MAEIFIGWVADALLASGAAWAGTTAAILVSNAVAIGLVLTVASSLAYSSYAASKAKRAARDAWNASIADRLVMQALVDGPRNRVYGRVRNVEGVVFKASHGTNLDTYTLLVAVAGHEIDFIETYYFDDLPVQVDSNGWVLSAPYFVSKIQSETFVTASNAGPFSIALPHAPVSATATFIYANNETAIVPVSISGSTVSGTLDTGGEDLTGTLTIQYQWNSGGSKARLRPYLGNSRPDLLSGLMADIPGMLTATDRFDGIALIRMDLTYDTDAFPSGLPSLSAVVRGARVYDLRNGLTVWSENPALCSRDWALYAYGGAVTTDVIDDASFVAAANACDISTNFLLNDVPGYTTLAYSPAGSTGIYVLGGSGAIKAGQRVSFAGDSTFYTVASGIAGTAGGITISPGLSQNLAGGVSLTIGSLRVAPLFTCGTVARTDQDPWNTFNELVESMAGKVGWPGGKLRVRAGVYSAPVVEITEDWLSGSDSIQITPEPPTDEAVNIYIPTIANGVPTTYGDARGYVSYGAYPVGTTSIPAYYGTGTIPAGEYVQFEGYPGRYLLDNGVTAAGQSLVLASPGLLQDITTPANIIPLGDLKTAYVAAPAPAVRADAYVLLDGRELTQQTTLSAVTDVWHAQHICGVMLRDARNGLAVTMPCNMRAFQLEMFDVVTVTLPRFGWAAKTFEVLGWQFSLSGGVTLTLKETTASIFQVDEGFSLIDQTPNSNLPNPFYVPVITGLSAVSGTSQLLIQGDGSIITRVLVSWDEVEDEAVRQSIRGGIVIRYGLASDDESLWESMVLPGDATQTYLTGVQDGAFYMITAQARNTLVDGSECPPIIHFVIGKTEPPPDVSSFSVQEQPDGRRIYVWTLDDPPLDLGGFRLRYGPPDGTPWESMIPLAEPGKFARTLEMYEPRDGEFDIAIKAVDTTGNESVHELRTSLLLDSTSIGTAIFVMRAHELGWPGIKDGCFVDGYQLTASSIDTWDTIPTTWDAWNTWDGATASPITYIDSTVDLGSVMTVRLRESSAASQPATSSYQSSTDGSTYTAWASVPSGVVTLRYVRVRWSVAGENPSMQRAQLSIYQ